MTQGAGNNPYFIPGGGSNEIGALGYVSSAQEILQQITAQNLDPKWIVVATGSAGTQAGLVAGFHAHDCDIPIMGISVRQPHDVQVENVYRLAVKTAALLTELPRSRVLVDDEMCLWHAEGWKCWRVPFFSMSIPARESSGDMKHGGHLSCNDLFDHDVCCGLHWPPSAWRHHGISAFRFGYEC